MPRCRPPTPRCVVHHFTRSFPSDPSPMWPGPRRSGLEGDCPNWSSGEAQLPLWRRHWRAVIGRLRWRSSADYHHRGGSLVCGDGLCHVRSPLYGDAEDTEHRQIHEEQEQAFPPGEVVDGIADWGRGVGRAADHGVVEADEGEGGDTLEDDGDGLFGDGEVS